MTAQQRWRIKMKKDPKRYAAHLARRRRYARQWRKNGGLEYQRRAQNSCNSRLKVVVLSYYGKGGKLLCSYRGCTISDIDMLTLDHVEDNGAEHRRQGNKGGVNGYRQLKQQGFPAGFQTLCCNHQMKKEIARRKNK